MKNKILITVVRKLKQLTVTVFHPAGSEILVHLQQVNIQRGTNTDDVCVIKISMMWSWNVNT